MPIHQLQVTDFMTIFTGNIHNYGQHNYSFNPKKKKEDGTNKTVTNKLLTQDQYKDHLEGKMGLGIIPINENNKCLFGGIDVDLYEQDLSIYIEAIERNNFPLVPFKSKSGGLHLYLFLKQFVEAKVMISLLTKMVTYLSLDILIKEKLNKMTEIFPKQYKLDAKSTGSWINLPYFNSAETKQFAIKDGKKQSLQNALVYMKEKRTTVADVKTFLEELPFQDAPPCLQAIYLLDPFKENTSRNNYLFSFGVYLKKKDENFFEQTLFEINNNLAHPLDSDELEKTILSSLRKKDYIYICKQAPCLNFCNQSVCKKREYGIGKEYGYFSNLDYGQLFQIKTGEPYYEWEIKVQDSKEFKKLRFKNESEIIGQDGFLRLCFRDLHILPIKLKQVEWFKIVNQYLVNVKIIEVSNEEDTSSLNLFRTLFFNFLLNRSMAQTLEQIANKRVYFSEDNEEYYFRAVDFLEYLYQKNFRLFDLNQIHGMLHDFNAKPKQIRTENKKQIRVSCISSKNVEQQASKKEKPFKPDFKQYDEEAF